LQRQQDILHLSSLCWVEQPDISAEVTTPQQFISEDKMQKSRAYSCFAAFKGERHSKGRVLLSIDVGY